MTRELRAESEYRTRAPMTAAPRADESLSDLTSKATGMRRTVAEHNLSFVLDLHAGMMASRAKPHSFNKPTSTADVDSPLCAASTT